MVSDTKTEEVNFCRYIIPGPIGEYNSPKCQMIGHVRLGKGDLVSALQPGYIRGVCNQDDVAKKVCEHFKCLRREEGITRRIKELSGELTGLAKRLSPYVAQPHKKLTE